MKKITKIEPSGEHIAARKLRVAARKPIMRRLSIQIRNGSLQAFITTRGLLVPKKKSGRHS